MSGLVVDPWIRRLNAVLAEDVMHGIQFCDLDDEEQQWFIDLRDRGYTPEEAIDAIQEGPM